MEGEAREALAAIPGLAKKGKMAPFVLLLSDNNTKLTGRIDSDSFSMQPTFESLAIQGWKVVYMAHPHDLQACVTVVEEALELAEGCPEQPVAIHAKTIKGYGTKATEESTNGGHGFPLKSASEVMPFLQEIYGDRKVPTEFRAWAEEMLAQQNEKDRKTAQPPAVAHEKIQKGVSAALIRKRKEKLPIISISSDLPGSTGVQDFQKEFPECVQDVGVAEANMISVAAGLSKEGFIPVVDTFAQFGVTKGALPLIMASLSQAPVIAFFSHTGFQDAADGASHQALSWLGMTASIPHCEVYSLTCSEEADALVGQAVDRFYRVRTKGKIPPTTIFFLGRENFPRYYGQKGGIYQLGKAQVVRDTTEDMNKSVTLMAGGSLMPQAVKATEILKAEGIGCLLVNPSILNDPDVETLKGCLQKSRGRLITAEDHQLVGGMGAVAAHTLVCSGVKLKLKSLGVAGQFGQSAYRAVELYEKHGLDSQAMIQAAREI